jgi:hypothetical protein
MRAFVEKPDMETKLIEAMKTGSTMKIEGKSAAAPPPATSTRSTACPLMRSIAPP